jgi:hypothetical protein
MVRFSLIIALPALATVGFSACTSPIVRRDWRSLSDDERSRFIDAQQQLWRSSIDISTGLSVYDTNFTKMHRDNTPFAHQVPAFLPWHRRFLRDDESALRTIDPSIALPYWNWAADNTRLNQSLVFDSKYFGGDGTGDDHCVQNGRYANWTLQLGGNVTDVNSNIQHCLRRVWSRGISTSVSAPPPVPNPDDIAGNITSFGESFDQFRRWWEGPHGTIHQGVGGFSIALNGDLTAVENSPNDPIFWLHHAFVDRTGGNFNRGVMQRRRLTEVSQTKRHHFQRTASFGQTGQRLAIVCLLGR